MSLTDGLVAYWRLDEASGTRADSSGNGRSLSESGAVGSDTGHISALAARLPGGSTNLYTADSAVTGAIVSTAGFTVAGWVWVDDDTQIYQIAGTLGGPATGLIMWRTKTSIWGYQHLKTQLLSAGNAFECEPAATIADGAWAFIAVKHDAATTSLYGRTNATTTGATNITLPVSAQAQFQIGDRGTFAGGTHLLGRAAHWGVWSRALTGAELDELYNSGAGLDPTASTQAPGLPIITHYHRAVFGG